MAESNHVTLRLEAELRYGRAICEPASDIPPGSILAAAPLFPGTPSPPKSKLSRSSTIQQRRTSKLLLPHFCCLPIATKP